MMKEIAEKIKNGDVPVQYRDPQEFMFCESRTSESDVFSFGMYIFRQVSGKDYFEYAGIPEDECYMMADPDSEKSVIDEKYIPEGFGYMAELLKGMTVYRRELRITAEEAAAVLEIFQEETDGKAGLPDDKVHFFSNEDEMFPESISEECNEPENSADIPEPGDRYAVKHDYDYGIILNNRRSGRIEFRPLLFHDGRTESYTLPVEKQGEFVIALSERHRDYSHISNPSSVYGDNIVPVGLVSAEDVFSAKLCISVKNESGILNVAFEEVSVTGEKTGKRYEVKRG